MKKNLLGVNLYLTQIVPWVVYGFGIIGLVKGNLPYELLWVAWFIVGSFLFYKYQAGKSASYWIAFLLSSSVMFLFHAAFLHHLFVLPTSRWLDAFQVVIWALILCCAIYQILERFTSIKIALSSLYFHRQVDTYKDLLRYKRDIEDRRLSNRYIPNVSVAIAEIQSSHALWREVVSVSISNCSMLLADITHILPSSSLAWELSEAYKNGIGVFFTCEATHMLEAKSVISSIGYLDYEVFTWQKVGDNVLGEHGVRFDSEKLLRSFFDCAKTQFQHST